MDVRRCGRRGDFFELVNGAEFSLRWALERHIAAAHAGEEEFFLPGYCTTCDRPVDFRVRFEGAWREGDGLLVPNWRETMNCPWCWLPGRSRMMVALAAQALAAADRPRVRAFISEQVTPVYRWGLWAFPGVEWIGSEYLGPDVAPGEVRDGIRHEDLERLSFAAGELDVVVSCDVLEHVNEPRRALSEIARVLRPGGRALLSFPMDPQLECNRRRARLRADGAIEHLLPEIRHGNPLSEEGSLVFTDFGWEVLDDMRAVGLGDAALYVYWSYELGYLGVQFYFSATRD